MIILNVCERQATALVKGRVTTDSVGLPVEVNLSPEYDGLAVWVCFRAGETAADVALMDGTEVKVPSQCLQVAGEALQVGVWAGDGDGNVRIPTVWASAGTIKQGTERSGIDPAGPAPDWAAQVQQYAQDAHDTAERLAEEVDGWETEIDAAVQGAETAAAAARAAASSASSAATSATNAASAASTAAGQASTAAGAATDAASEATGAAASATAAAADATEAAGLADNATAAANAAASNAETATREAITATTGANTAAATANAAAGSATDAASSATTAAGTATDAATSATSAASAAGTAADAANTAATAANAAAEAATEAAEGITEAYFPGLAAGSADGITGGGPLDTAAWLSRACPGSDGPARIESIHGRTLGWNQLAPVPFRGQATAAGITYTPNSDGSVSISGTATRTVYERIGTTQTVVGHKYVVYMGGTINSSPDLYIYNDGGGINTGTSNKILATATAAKNVFVRIANGATIDGTIRPQIFDLTTMFGAGNEPATVAEFEALYPLPYYPYDAGSLLPVHMTGVETVAADESWTYQRTIPASTYFPDGMRSAGSAYDELTSDAAIVRVGAVDLGTLTWRVTTTGSTGQYRMVSNGIRALIAKPASSTVLGDMKCSKYETLTSSAVYQLYTGISVASDGDLVAYDPSYATADSAAAFKTAMSGVMLHYALATPTTTPIDPPLNLTYKAAQGGTERVMHDEPTAPPTLVVQYGSTAGGIRDRALAAIADPDGPVAQSNHAIGTYLTMGGTLYKVTRAIAVGETIAAGTNVTETTVMAEVLSLIQ